jgi:uncharacterized membrane protein
MNTATSTAPFSAASTNDKTTAIVSYLTLFGFIAAVIMQSSKKSRLGAFHLRQMLGLMVTSVVVWIAAMICMFVPFVGWLVSLTAWVALFALWLMGLMSALQGEQKPVPVLGEGFQKWLGSAFD